MSLLDDADAAEELDVANPSIIGDAEFEEAFGETLDRTLDFGTWTDGDDLAAAYQRLYDQISQAVRQESHLRERTRAYVFDRLRERHPAMGVFTMPFDDLKRIHEQVLFNGGIEVSDGTSLVHDTLPITVAQIGVCIVAYSGRQNTWVRRTFRRDVRLKYADPLEEVIEALNRRGQRSSDMAGRHDQMSNLGRRGIMAYAERAILREKGKGNWYLGHGTALPYELLTGSGHMGLLDRALDVLEWLWLSHKRALYVPSSPGRTLQTIGNALDPLEYAFVDTAEHAARQIVDHGHYAGAARRRLEEFVADVAPQLVVGVYRAAPQAPAYAFYAHRDYAHLAARIAIADAALQENRGFPMLIDLADAVCRTTFGGGAFLSVLESAYAEAGAPYAYMPERATRRTR
jgi:hypothetical protein